MNEYNTSHNMDDHDQDGRCFHGLRNRGEARPDRLNDREFRRDDLNTVGNH